MAAMKVQGCRMVPQKSSDMFSTGGIMNRQQFAAVDGAKNRIDRAVGTIESVASTLQQNGKGADAAKVNRAMQMLKEGWKLVFG